jgi:hypothetical protein
MNPLSSVVLLEGLHCVIASPSPFVILSPECFRDEKSQCMAQDKLRIAI